MWVRVQIAAMVYLMVQAVMFGIGVMLVLGTPLADMAMNLGRRDERRAVNPDLLDDRSAPARAVLGEKGIAVRHHLGPELRVAILRLLA